MSWTQSYAHDSTRAFFTIPENGRYGRVQVQAEFPWIIRTALSAYDTTLNTNKSRDAFDKALFNYAKANLIMKDAEGKALPLIKAYEVEEGGHGHQNNFIFEYRGNGVNQITNTMLFNVSEQQLNYHNIITDYQDVAFETTPFKPAFIIEYVPKTWKDYLPCYIGGLLLLAGWIWRKRQAPQE